MQNKHCNKMFFSLERYCFYEDKSLFVDFKARRVLKVHSFLSLLCWFRCTFSAFWRSTFASLWGSAFAPLGWRVLAREIFHPLSLTPWLKKADDVLAVALYMKDLSIVSAVTNLKAHSALGDFRVNLHRSDEVSSSALATVASSAPLAHVRLKTNATSMLTSAW